MKAVDRPLFQDFWERFLAALDALRERKQRTVYRLTLILGQNMKELDEYVNLIARGQPDFIEVKGVTWCMYLVAGLLFYFIYLFLLIYFNIIFIIIFIFIVQ